MFWTYHPNRVDPLETPKFIKAKNSIENIAESVTVGSEMGRKEESGARPFDKIN